MRLLGLDVGEKRIGVALSEEGILARPLSVIHRRSRTEDFAAIGELLQMHQIECVVVGLPTSAEGEIGSQARRIKRFARELARTVSAPLVFVDESYTTVDALDIMKTVGKTGRRQREQVDAVAAAVILEAYLNRAGPDGPNHDRPERKVEGE
jgi:putative holliday junction resolvase